MTGFTCIWITNELRQNSPQPLSPETRDSDTEQCLIKRALVITNFYQLTITLVTFVVGYIYIKQQCRRYYYHSCLPSCLPYRDSHVPAAQIWSEVALTALFLYPIYNSAL